jgi:iron complex transport system substrate-binding protein
VKKALAALCCGLALQLHAPHAGALPDHTPTAPAPPAHTSPVHTPPGQGPLAQALPQKTPPAQALPTPAPQPQALQVVDDRGVAVGLARPPQRIVSLLPSLTETVCALGACQRLVGVDRYSNFPAEVRALPQVGGGLDPNLEAILALRPDLVLAAASSRGIARLEALGLKVLALEPKTAADVERVLGQLGPLLGRPGEAARVWRDIDAGVAAAAASLPAGARGLRVYFEVNAGPYGAGAGSFIGQTLQRLGARNILGPELGVFPRINPEFVVRADPDLIMLSESGEPAGGFNQRPGWAGMRAVRGQRICRFTPAQGDVLVRPGPRMAEAAWIMARCIARHAP